MQLLETRLPSPGSEEYVLRLRSVHGPEITPYAILSHTWLEQGEILLEDIIGKTAETKPKSFSKVIGALAQARTDGHEYMWIDSCCIDKTSSAELTEAINSMFPWYQQADQCYAHLEDVGADGAGFTDSRWFRRGWTLQELLAPSRLEFFARDWTWLGDKKGLCTLICATTRIDKTFLLGERTPESASLAQRMSWAAGRQTTRGEDRAYSLMGLFDVNLPTIYGEGATKAFLRLQKAIMERSTDHSLFAWVDDSKEADDGHDMYHLHGLLADSPDFFGSAGSIVAGSDFGRPYSMTNRGLHIELDMVQRVYPMSHLMTKRGLLNKTREWVAKLDCVREGELLTIDLFLLSNGQYARSLRSERWPFPQRGEYEVKSIYVSEIATRCKKLITTGQHLQLFKLPAESHEFQPGYAWRNMVHAVPIKRPQNIFTMKCDYGPDSSTDRDFSTSEDTGLRKNELALSMALHNREDQLNMVIRLGTGVDGRPGVEVFSIHPKSSYYGYASFAEQAKTFRPGLLGVPVRMESGHVVTIDATPASGAADPVFNIIMNVVREKPRQTSAQANTSWGGIMGRVRH